MMRTIAAAVILTLLMPLNVWSSACRRAWGARKGEPAPCHGVILPIEGAKRCARATIDLRACKDSLAEWRRRAAIPLPMPCTPTTLTVIKPIEKPRPVWHVAVAAVVGFAAGVWVSWRVSK